MRLLAPIMISAILATGGCASAGANMSAKPSVDDAYIIKTIGEPKSCIPRSHIRSTSVIDGQTIDFIMNNGDIYRNNLPSKCSGLAFEKAFSYRTSINQLCSVDIIRVLNQTAGRIETGAACGLGKFQKIEKISKDKTED